MIQIAIVEDDQESAETLRHFLEQYQAERGCEWKIVEFQDGEEIIQNYRPEYDIILMDVQMDRLDGMTAAEIIRQQDPEVILIFITNMPQYAIRGYAVEALDYVLKPVSHFAFSQRMDRALSRIDRNRTHYIVLPVKGCSQKVDVAQIRYVESRGAYPAVSYAPGGDRLQRHHDRDGEGAGAIRLLPVQQGPSPQPGRGGRHSGRLRRGGGGQAPHQPGSEERLYGGPGQPDGRADQMSAIAVIDFSTIPRYYTALAE